MSIPALFLFGILYHVEVVNVTYPVSPNGWVFSDSADWVYPHDVPVNAHVWFNVTSGPPVRLMVLDHGELERLRNGETPTPVRLTAGELTDTITHPCGRPENCVFVIDNRGSAAKAVVKLIVTVDSWEPPELSPQRKLTVLVISFCVFFGMIGYAGAKLWRAQIR